MWSPWGSHGVPLDDHYRGRNTPYGVPPAQIPAGAIHAPGSHLGCLTEKRTLGHG